MDSTADQQQPPERPEQPPAADPGQPPPESPKRLLRSREDRVLGGVCGGIARYLGVDATVVRVLAVVLVLLGGAGVLAYVAALLVIPSDPDAAGATTSAASSDRTLRIVVLVLLLIVGGPLILGAGLLVMGLVLPIATLVVLGLAVWWLVSGEGPKGEGADIARRAALGIGVLFLCGLIATGGAVAAGLGGGTVVAALVIGAGVMLVIGAFAGGARWLIPPALSLALAVGFVAAAGIDFDGGVGEREYRPTSASELEDGYRLGMGELRVDLRDADLPSGDTPLDLDIGIGEARLIVPSDVCVATSAQVGIGEVEVFDRQNGGIDLDWTDRPRSGSDVKRLVVDANVGIGALHVRRDDLDLGPPSPPRPPFTDEDDYDDYDDEEAGNLGCTETRAAR